MIPIAGESRCVRSRSRQVRPQYGGFCAFGTAGGYKAATQPSAFTIVGSKLYLNYNQEVQKKWSSDIPGYVTSADRKWPEVSRQAKVIE